MAEATADTVLRQREEKLSEDDKKGKRKEGEEEKGNKTYIIYQVNIMAEFVVVKSLMFVAQPVNENK